MTILTFKNITVLVILDQCVYNASTHYCQGRHPYPLCPLKNIVSKILPLKYISFKGYVLNVGWGAIQKVSRSKNRNFLSPSPMSHLAILKIETPLFCHTPNCDKLWAENEPILDVISWSNMCIFFIQNVLSRRTTTSKNSKNSVITNYESNIMRSLLNLWLRTPPMPQLFMLLASPSPPRSVTYF